MGVAGSRIAVIGGSIAGCAAATALARAGCSVEVFERSSGELRDRGAGIIIPIPLRNELQQAGYLPADYAVCTRERRWWLIADGTPEGRLLWAQPSVVVLNNWGVLWRSLRRNVPDANYHDGMVLRSLENQPDGVVVTFGDGSTDRFDMLVGADGYRSAIRAQLHPGSMPSYAGNVLWRGNYEESRVRDSRYLERMYAASATITVCFEGGHGLLFMIPNFDDGTELGHRRVNWGVYTPNPPGHDFTEPTTIAPGDVDEEMYSQLDRIFTESFPAEAAALFRLSAREEVSIQPIYDQLVDSYTSGRVMLIGDSGTVTRPLTSSGATKALQDAMALERIANEADDLDSLLQTYNTERVANGNSIVEMGRRIGRAQVEETPDWGRMTPADFETWIQDQLAGERLYLYGDIGSKK